MRCVTSALYFLQASLTLVGALGVAILTGILSSLSDLPSTDLPLSGSLSGVSTPLQSHSRPLSTYPREELPPRLPSKFIACVKRPESEKRVKSALLPWISSVSISIMCERNVAACAAGDVVLLGCKPHMITSILGEKGMREALKGKLLISILAGVTEPKIEEAIYGSDVPSLAEKCRVVRAMPNTASEIRESMTVVAISEPPLPADLACFVTWVFKRIGDVIYLPSSNMDASTALCGSGPGFFFLMLEGAVTGAIAKGIPKAEAYRMAAQTMKGAAGLVLAGDHPALLRDKVSTPGGCTIAGLMVLEEAAVRGIIAKAIGEATTVAAGLGNK